jgi:hypothetical protein
MLFLAPFPYPGVSETTELWSKNSFIDRQVDSRESLELSTANQVRVYGSRGQKTVCTLSFHWLGAVTAGRCQYIHPFHAES